MTFLMGVDLGQSQDDTAIAIVERLESQQGAEGQATARYALRHLERPPRGTPYPEIVAYLGTLLDRPPLTRAARLVVDRTGVGTAVLDLLRDAHLSPLTVTITGSDALHWEDPSTVRVPKRELAFTLVALLQTRRLMIAPELPLADALFTDLRTFTVKIAPASGLDSYEAWRENPHDDLVLALALACWAGETPPPGPLPGVLVMGKVRNPWLPGYGRRRASDAPVSRFAGRHLL